MKLVVLTDNIYEVVLIIRVKMYIILSQSSTVQGTKVEGNVYVYINVYIPISLHLLMWLFIGGMLDT